jgi:hypothetical protein
MTRARARALAVLIAVIAAAAVALAVARQEAARPQTRQHGPTLLLLTSLPLIFPEEFSLNGRGSPALAALRRRYQVVPISVTDAQSLHRGTLLLMAQPPAQAPEHLVALDNWVRSGGRVLLLADPLLEWPSTRPLGDALRPPTTFTDTGLLAHWGLRLDAPDERGPRLSRLGGDDILTVSPGTLVGRCGISADGLVARCRVGRGQATIVADADFLDTTDLDGPTDHNLDALLAALDALQPD